MSSTEILLSEEKSEKIDLEGYFKPFRQNIVGTNLKFQTNYGKKKLIYADWTASGRLYGPIEERLSNDIGQYLGNTHTETSITGMLMTNAYHKAQKIIKEHVHAGKDDVLILTGSGMTGAINKFQRILGLRWPEQASKQIKIPPAEKPIVFVTHMEHHSNHTSWLETQADVECISPDKQGLIDLNNLKELLEIHKDRKIKIAAITACSNVTGIITDYFEVARIMHRAGGFCFVDFACSAPYVEVNMHPDDEEAKLDAIYFSPHKFLGGPGSPGALVFNSKFYKNRIPDQPGGGTVMWTNPWGGRWYWEDIEMREDGGTPAFLQTIKAAMAIRLKEEMGIEKIVAREHELVERIFDGFSKIRNINILAGEHKNRLGVISFYYNHLHFDLVTRLLNDRFGIQSRGGCSCAGTYGHYLLQISEQQSNEIADHVDHGEMGTKPGWARLSIHPTTTNEEVEIILSALDQISEHGKEWEKDYLYDSHTNTYKHTSEDVHSQKLINEWFDQV